MDEQNKCSVNKYLTYILSYGLAIAFLFAGNAVAKNNTFPPGCKQKGYSFKHRVLVLHPEAAGKSQSLYFVHNKTLSSVKLYQMKTGDEPYILYLNNTIRPNQWGVFATDERKVRFICALPSKQTRHGDIIDCGRALEGCEYTNVKFSINTYGNYWAVGSKTRRGAINSIVHQGILLKW